MAQQRDSEVRRVGGDRLLPTRKWLALLLALGTVVGARLLGNWLGYEVGGGLWSGGGRWGRLDFGVAVALVLILWPDRMADNPAAQPVPYWRRATGGDLDAGGFEVYGWAFLAMCALFRLVVLPLGHYYP